MTKKKIKIDTNPWFTQKKVDYNQIRKNMVCDKKDFYNHQNKINHQASQGIRKIRSDLQITKQLHKKTATYKQLLESFLFWFEHISILWKLWVVCNPLIIGLFILTVNYENLVYTKNLCITYSLFWFIMSFLILYINHKYGIQNIKASHFKSLQTTSNFTGYIYMINTGSEVPGHIALKIGMTTRSPERRLRDYKTGNPYAVVIKSWKCYDNLSKLEQYAHSIAKQYASHYSSEVFYFSDKECIGHTIEKIGMNINLIDNITS